MTDRELCRKILSNLTQVRFSRRVDFFDVLGDLARCVIRIGNRSIVQRRSFMVTHSPRFEIHNRPIWEIDDSFASVSRRRHARQTGGFQSEDCTTGCILTLILFGCTTSRTVDTQQTECTHHFFMFYRGLHRPNNHKVCGTMQLSVSSPSPTIGRCRSDPVSSFTQRYHPFIFEISSIKTLFICLPISNACEVSLYD